ncbi:hypothetical protein Tco_0342933, partial [Tanacetum coccineum]
SASAALLELPTSTESIIVACELPAANSDALHLSLVSMGTKVLKFFIVISNNSLSSSKEYLFNCYTV